MLTTTSRRPIPLRVTYTWCHWVLWVEQQMGASRQKTVRQLRRNTWRPLLRYHSMLSLDWTNKEMWCCFKLLHVPFFIIIFCLSNLHFCISCPPLSPLWCLFSYRSIHVFSWFLMVSSFCNTPITCSYIKYVVCRQFHAECDIGDTITEAGKCSASFLFIIFPFNNLSMKQLLIIMLWYFFLSSLLLHKNIRT